MKNRDLTEKSTTDAKAGTAARSADATDADATARKKDELTDEQIGAVVGGSSPKGKDPDIIAIL